MKVESYGKCPSCGRETNRVDAGHVTVCVALSTQWQGVSYTCPNCHAILGVQIDPVALKTDIVNEILGQLQKSR